MRSVLTIIFTLLCAPCVAFDDLQPEDTTAIADRTSVTTSQYMVAAAHPLAAQAGQAVLAKGGSAADAAIAVQLMLNLVEPQSSGIGGGAFALYWDANSNSLTTFDGRETAPLAATPAYWLNEDGSPKHFYEAVAGGRSVGVPGTLKLLETLHRNYGTQPWADLMTTAIETATNGFPVSQRLAQSIARAQEKGLAAFEASRSYFFDETGAPLSEGHILKNPQFAAVLKRIATEGTQSFYSGNIATDIIAATQTPENAGILTEKDFADYKVIERPAVCADYRVYEVCGMGPPSSGGLTVGQILKILENFDLAAMGKGAQAYHLFAEASKLAYADRALYMADSDFVKMPQGLLNTDYLKSRASLISTSQAMDTAQAGTPPWEETRLYSPDTQVERPGTSHFSIVDAMGNMISMTTTIETGFGSRVMTHGFLLNNELTDFSFAPEKDGLPVANRVEAGKRPRSSMAPTVVLKDGHPILLTGSPGGSRIIEYVAQSLVAILDWQLDPQQAIDLGHVINRNGSTELEERSDAILHAASLIARGHSIKIRDLNSGLHVIQINGDKLTGAADKRREGAVLGE